MIVKPHELRDEAMRLIDAWTHDPAERQQRLLAYYRETLLPYLVEERKCGAGWKGMADRLNVIGIPTTTGKQWYGSLVRSMCVLGGYTNRDEARIKPYVPDADDVDDRDPPLETPTVLVGAARDTDNAPVVAANAGGRPATGTVDWRRDDLGKMRWHVRVTLQDGSRPWVPLDPSLTRDDEDAARVAGAETSAQMRAAGTTSVRPYVKRVLSDDTPEIDTVPLVRSNGVPRNEAPLVLEAPRADTAYATHGLEGHYFRAHMPGVTGKTIKARTGRVIGAVGPREDYWLVEFDERADEVASKRIRRLFRLHDMADFEFSTEPLE